MSKLEFTCGPEWDRRVITLRPKKKIGLLVSGGIDSTVLYHLLKDHSDLTLYHMHNIRNKPAYVRNAIGDDNLDIKTFSEKDFSSTKILGGELLKLKAISLEQENDIDQLYSAGNALPPASHFPEFNIDGIFRSWKFPEDSFMAGPFLPLFKYHIIDLAIKLNIDLTATHSCTRNLDGSECRECFNCMERTWGYAQLGLSDPKFVVNT